MSAVEVPDVSPGRHLVQFYEADEASLIVSVGRYIAAGLSAGNCAIAVTTPEHEAGFTAYLEQAGIRTVAARALGQLVFLDAHTCLRRLSVNGYPDVDRFENIVGKLVRESNSRFGGVCAYGEMVGLLWSMGEYPAAIRLEQLWHRLLKEVDFSLYCAYAIDIFSDNFESGVVDALLCAHTHLVSCCPNVLLEESLQRAAREVFQPNVIELTGLRRPAWPVMPRGEAIILWLRRQPRALATDILARAREYYRNARLDQLSAARGPAAG